MQPRAPRILRVAAAVAVAAGTVTFLSTCATAPPVELCPDRALLAPAPTQMCLSEPASRRFLLRSGHRIGDRLTGWRGRPGSVRLAVSFAPDTSVDSVCLRGNEGSVPADRIRSAARDLRSAQGAPECFAGRRIEFDWQSPTVTAYEIRRAEVQCDPAAYPTVRHLEFCRWTQSCQVSEILRLKEDADDRVARCVLQQVPISIVASDTERVVMFLPAEGSSPGAQDALDSLSACDGKTRESDGIACMTDMGWRPIE